MISQTVIEQITDLIVRITRPRKVYLFGSQASDTARDDSDLDIMIVVDDDTVDLRGLRQSVHLEISSSLGLPCDVLIEHESTFAQRSSLPTIERTILETGQILYAA